MKLAIVGGRDFDDFDRLEKWANEFDATEIVSGGAKGADTLAETYAKKHGIKMTVYPAKWDDMSAPCRVKRNSRGEMYNALAGMNRNTTIVDNCDAIIIFWNGKSSGTKDTLDKARKAEKKIVLAYYGESLKLGTETQNM